MAITNFPNGVSSFGVPIYGSGQFPNPLPGGDVWFVSSTMGSNGFIGSVDQPFATLAFALTQTALSEGDVIVVLEGHSETVTAAAGLLAATTAVQIVGRKLGTRSPTITFTTATTASMKVTAAGVGIYGLRFVNGIASQATMLDIQGKSCIVQGNTFVQGASTTGLSFIDMALATANSADGLKLLNNTFYNPTAGNHTHLVGLNSVHDDIEIANNYGVGQCSLSCVHNVTGNVVTNLNMHDNYFRNLSAAKPALQFVSAVTGKAYRNVLIAGDMTVNSAKIGTALDFTGNNRINNGNADAGQEFWLSKTGVVSSTITQAGVDLTVASIGGAIAIKDVIVKSNGTGLAGMTNFTVTSNNANGASVFFSTAASGLGANGTVNLVNASVTKSETVLETGKKLTLKATAADGTGAGTIDIHVLCQRMQAGADLSIA